MIKIAFQPSNSDEPKSSIGDTIKKITAHPGEFLKSTYTGQLQGLSAGALGGAIVSIPFAMALARKPKSLARLGEIIKAQKKLSPIKRFAAGMDASAPKYSQRMTHHMFELAKGETIGGGVIGMMLAQNKFLKKYDDDKGEYYAAMPKTKR